MRKIYKKVNTCQSVVEFNSFGDPPAYIFYCGELIGETIGYLPLRVGKEDM